MGFFSRKAVCAACEKEVGMNRFQIANKEWICPQCFRKCNFNMATPIKTLTIDDIRSALKKADAYGEELEAFTVSKQVIGFLEIDDIKKKWLIPDGLLGKKKKPKIYKYSDILDYELLEDGESIVKGGLGRAVVGGALFGGVGAVVGGVTGKKKSKEICKSLKIKVTLNDVNNPVAYISFIATEFKKSSLTYQQHYRSAQECISLLQYMCSNSDTRASASETNLSASDEIKEFKKLMDEGLITEEEFTAKKKQILGI